MKILVLGLDCAAPEILLEMPELTNIRRLMSKGAFGPLESVVPPITVPAWMCMATSQDPGSLGIYGFRNRTGYDYQALGTVNSSSIQEKAIWDVLNEHGKAAIIVGVPPNFPPRRVHGASIGCFLTPDTKTSPYAYPIELKPEIDALVGEYPVDVKGFRTNDKAALLERIYEMSRRQFQVCRHLMSSREWHYFQFVDIGLDRVHHGFWKYHDREHRHHEPGSIFQNAVRDYYRHLDGEIGSILELIEKDTIVLVVSDHGARRLDGGFCVNEWLWREGLLVLKQPLQSQVPFSAKLVDWSRTKVWSEGGYYARVFLNVKGREPEGVVEPSEYEALRTELAARFEALPDDTGAPMGNLVFRPELIYKHVRNIAPDLIVHFGGLSWRSIGGLGYDSVYVQENDTGPDDCNHAQFGSFILSGPGIAPVGRVSGAQLLDIAPTLLPLAGLPVPDTMQGRNLVDVFSMAGVR
jgi:predicted AlkP superfamily phosphohydrolase/phosphomutase